MASYVFYGWWDYRFLILIFISSIVDYFCGLSIHQESDERKRKLFLYLSIGVNLGLLGFFKYFNFFVDSFVTAFNGIGMEMEYSTLQIILPVGISFYTFQTLSYTIDIYRRELEPTKDPVAFFAFVAFFPQLIAGPIERASKLIPQITAKRMFSYDQATSGMRQIAWGLMQKVVIADNLAHIIDPVFAHPENSSGLLLFKGACFFSIQVYCDFAGYSNIAIGMARLLGIKLTINFRTPFFSRDYGEFWQRWHITLLQWFRDYIYIPLGGSRVNKAILYRNILLVFLIGGLWHGANWNFLVWGALNGVFFLVSKMLFGNDKSRSLTTASNQLFPNGREVLGMLFCYISFTLSMIIFRIEDFNVAYSFFDGLIHHDWTNLQELSIPMVTGLNLLILFVFEWFLRERNFGLDIGHWHKLVRWGCYILICLNILKFGNFGEKVFVYFQF